MFSLEERKMRVHEKNEALFEHVKNFKEDKLKLEEDKMS
jgi:hypothetical protein